MNKVYFCISLNFLNILKCVYLLHSGFVFSPQPPWQETGSSGVILKYLKGYYTGTIFRSKKALSWTSFQWDFIPPFYLNMEQPLCKERKKSFRHVSQPYRWVQHVKVNIAYNSTTPLSSPSLRVCGENKRIIKFNIISCMREMAASSGNMGPNDEWQSFWLLWHGQGPSQRSTTHTRPRCC